MTPQRLVRFSALVTFVFAQVTMAASPDVEAASKDRAAHFSPADFDSIFYITTRPHAGANAIDLERAIKLAIASDTVQPVIERSVPVKVVGAEYLYRIDIRDLRWRHEDWYEVAKNRNPYFVASGGIVRADWLLVEISDMQESDSYQRLLFGGDKIPKTQDDVLKFFKVLNDPALTFGLIEGQSEVSVQGRRLVTSLPSPRGYAWITSDVLKLDNNRDPLEHIDNKFTPDGQEGIIGIPKLSSTTGKRGTLQWYWLNNGKKILVNRAPVDLVEDHTHFRGFREIRTPGSCIQCHAGGLNPFKRNEVRRLIDSGVKLFAGSKQRADLEAFHLSDLSTELARANDDFQTMVELICACKSSDAVGSFAAAVNRYDAALGLEETAEELGVKVEDWTKVLATNTDLPAGLVSLPHQNPRGQAGTISRAAWEEDFAQAYFATHEGKLFKRADVKPVKPEVNVEVKAEVKPAVKPQPVRQNYQNRGEQ